MILQIVAILAGFILLVWSADKFVLGAAATARNLGVPPIIIGLTIVGLGTSAPEMLVSGVAAWQGNPGLAIGNALGSNITNIALILGITALVTPLAVASRIVRREMPLLIAVMLLGYLLLMDGELGIVDGLILLTGLGLLMGWMIWEGFAARNKDHDPLEQEYLEEIPADLSTAAALAWVLIGLLLLLLSSRLLVWGAVGIAQSFGVSDLIIGLTIVALGTSLPELAASLASALKNEHDIAIGNVIGSNMFNLLAVMGIPAVIAPGPISAEILQRDYPIMLILTLVLLFLAHGWRKPGRINRLEGGFLVACYIGYQVLLYFAATGNPDW